MAKINNSMIKHDKKTISQGWISQKVWLSVFLNSLYLIFDNCLFAIFDFAKFATAENHRHGIVLWSVMSIYVAWPDMKCYLPFRLQNEFCFATFITCFAALENGNYLIYSHTKTPATFIIIFLLRIYCIFATLASAIYKF